MQASTTHNKAITDPSENISNSVNSPMQHHASAEETNTIRSSSKSGRMTPTLANDDSPSVTTPSLSSVVREVIMSTNYIDTQHADYSDNPPTHSSLPSGNRRQQTQDRTGGSPFPWPHSIPGMHEDASELWRPNGDEVCALNHQISGGDGQESESATINEQMLQILSDINEELANSNLAANLDQAFAPLVDNPYDQQHNETYARSENNIGTHNNSGHMTLPITVGQELIHIPFPHISGGDQSNMNSSPEQICRQTDCNQVNISNNLNSASNNSRLLNPNSQQSTPLLHASLTGGLTSLPESQFYSSLPPQPQSSMNSSIGNFPCACGRGLTGCICGGSPHDTVDWRRTSSILKSACESSDNLVVNNRGRSSTSIAYIPGSGGRGQRPWVSNENLIISPLISSSSSIGHPAGQSPSRASGDIPTDFGNYSTLLGHGDSASPSRLLGPLSLRTSFSGRLSPSNESQSGRLAPGSAGGGSFNNTKFISSSNTSPTMKYKKAPAKGWWKTEICKFWRDGGGCRNEANCRWAHGSEELRHWDSMDPGDDEDSPSLDADNGHLGINTATPKSNSRLNTPVSHSMHPQLYSDICQSSSDRNHIETPPIHIDSSMARRYTAESEQDQTQTSNVSNQGYQGDHLFTLFEKDCSPSRMLMKPMDMTYSSFLSPSQGVNVNRSFAAESYLRDSNWIVFPLTCYGKQKRATFMGELWAAIKTHATERASNAPIIPYNLKRINSIIVGNPGIQINPLFWRSMAFTFRNVKDSQQLQHKRKCAMCGTSEGGSRNGKDRGNVSPGQSKCGIEPITLGWTPAANVAHRLQVDSCSRCRKITSQKRDEILEIGNWLVSNPTSSQQQRMLDWIIRLTSIIKAVEHCSWHLEGEMLDVLSGEGGDKSMAAQNALVSYQQKVVRAAVLVDQIIKSHVDMTSLRKLITNQVISDMSLVEWMVISDQPTLFVALLYSHFPLTASPSVTRIKHRFPNNAEFSDPSMIDIDCPHKLSCLDHLDDPNRTNFSSNDRINQDFSGAVNHYAPEVEQAVKKDSQLISTEVSTAGNSPTSSHETFAQNTIVSNGLKE